MRRDAIALLLVGLAVAACAGKAPVLPPVRGPAVLSEAGVEILDWEYLGPDSVRSVPEPAANVREVEQEAEQYSIYLIRTDEGFELMWSQVLCAIRPVLVVHVGMSLEFWPGQTYCEGEVPMPRGCIIAYNPDGSVDYGCEAVGVAHEITVKLQTSIPFDQWTFTLHPPPAPTPERWRPGAFAAARRIGRPPRGVREAL
jgi:hypothetical protein